MPEPAPQREAGDQAERVGDGVSGGAAVEPPRAEAERGHAPAGKVNVDHGEEGCEEGCRERREVFQRTVDGRNGCPLSTTNHGRRTTN